MKRRAIGALLVLGLGCHSGLFNWLRDYCDPFVAADREFEARLRRDAEEFERWRQRQDAEQPLIVAPSPTVILVDYVVDSQAAVFPDDV